MKKCLIISGFVILIIAGVTSLYFLNATPATDINIPKNEVLEVSMGDYIVEWESEGSVDYPQFNSFVYKVENNKKIFIYKGQQRVGFNIVGTSHYPYLVMEYGCSECDGPREGSMILNVETKKAMTLLRKDVLSFDVSQNVARVQSFEYEQVVKCEYELCSPNKIIGTESTVDLSTIN